jgi:serine/threonine protein phosphatase 1
MRQFAIGDIHGCHKTLLALLDSINYHESDELYFLGDYVDRGDDSKAVLDTLLDLQKHGNVLCLRGNHEQIMLDAFDSEPNEFEEWLLGIGAETYLSLLGATETEMMGYLDFMNNLPLVHTVGDYIMVHGGINFNQTDPLSSTHQMMWLRDWYDKIDYQWLGNRYILHGHTPMEKPIIQLMHQTLKQKRVLNLDNGCVFNRPQKNSLACFELQTQELVFQPNVEH